LKTNCFEQRYSCYDYFCKGFLPQTGPRSASNKNALISNAGHLLGNLPLLVLLVQQCEAEHPTNFVLMSCTWLTFDDKSNGIHHCIVYSVCFFSNRCLEKPIIECDLICDSAENHLHKRLKCGFKQVTSMPPTNLNSYLMILNRKEVTDIT